MATLHPMLQPFVPTPADPWDRLKAAHLLNRAAWGGSPTEIDHALEAGPRDAVDALLDFPDAASDQISKSDQPDLSQIQGYPRTFADRQRLFVGKTPEERQLINQRLNQSNQEALRAVTVWWIRRMATGPYPLHEKLTFFWHGHFTTSARDERSAWLMWSQNELLREHAAGNFGKFVHAVSHDPAMLDYLNNQENRKAHPNENYARELMELFTLGIGNYTEQDVKEGARAFTGWAHDGEGFIFRKFDHDTGEKNFLGRRGNWDGEDVINIILSQRVCSTYIASRLWHFFVNEDPDPAICQSLGDVLRDNNYELRPLLRTMFTSRAFYAKDNIGSIIKCPVQLVVGTTRALDVDVPDYGRLYGSLEQMGQVPLQPPNVKGWPGGRLWINTSTLFVRQNTAIFLAGGQAVTSGKPLIDRRNQRKPMPAIDVDTDGTPEALVDHWITRLIQRPIDPARRDVLVQSLNGKPTQAGVANMVKLILSMPEYQLC